MALRRVLEEKESRPRIVEIEQEMASLEKALWTERNERGRILQETESRIKSLEMGYAQRLHELRDRQEALIVEMKREQAIILEKALKETVEKDAAFWGQNTREVREKSEAYAESIRSLHQSIKSLRHEKEKLELDSQARILHLEKRIDSLVNDIRTFKEEKARADKGHTEEKKEFELARHLQIEQLKKNFIKRYKLHLKSLREEKESLEAEHQAIILDFRKKNAALTGPLNALEDEKARVIERLGKENDSLKSASSSYQARADEAQAKAASQLKKLRERVSRLEAKRRKTAKKTSRMRNTTSDAAFLNKLQMKCLKELSKKAKDMLKPQPSRTTRAGLGILLREISDLDDLLAALEHGRPGPAERAEGKPPEEKKVSLPKFVERIIPRLQSKLRQRRIAIIRKYPRSGPETRTLEDLAGKIIYRTLSRLSDCGRVAGYLFLSIGQENSRESWIRFSIHTAREKLIPSSYDDWALENRLMKVLGGRLTVEKEDPGKLTVTLYFQ